MTNIENIQCIGLKFFFSSNTIIDDSNRKTKKTAFLHLMKPNKNKNLHLLKMCAIILYYINLHC